MFPYILDEERDNLAAELASDVQNSVSDKDLT